MLKKIPTSIIIVGNLILTIVFYRISSVVYGWHYSYPSPIEAPFRYILPEIRPIIGLYWSLPPSEILAYSLFIVLHVAEALLIFFIAGTTLKYLFGQQIQITYQSCIKGICIFFGTTLAHVFFNAAIIYTLLSFTGYGSLIGILGIWSIPFCIIFSFFIIPLAYLFLTMNFIAAIILLHPATSLKNAFNQSIQWWWPWSYLFALINCFSIMLSDIFLRTTSTPPITTCLYMGIITVSSVVLVTIRLKKYSYSGTPKDTRKLPE